MSEQLDPGHIMQTATAFWASKTLLTAVELELFTVLGQGGAMTAAQLGDRLGLAHPRGTYDFFDALLALGFLLRDGDGPEATYRNTPETAAFLDKAQPTYVGGLPEMMNTRLYANWGRLGEALKTGQPQNEYHVQGIDIFESLYGDPDALKTFLEAMSGVQAGNFALLSEKIDFSSYKTLSDIGGALALLSRIVGGRHRHLHCTSFDLPQVAPHARAAVEAAGMGSRIAIAEGDFFADPLPVADVVTMGNILHDWGEERKRQLIAKAFAAVHPGGCFIAIENVIDDARREHAFGLLMSLNMLIELGEGFDYTGAQFDAWCKDAGFARTEIIPLAGPSSAAIAYKDG